VAVSTGVHALCCCCVDIDRSGQSGMYNMSVPFTAQGYPCLDYQTIYGTFKALINTVCTADANCTNPDSSKSAGYGGSCNVCNSATGVLTCGWMNDPATLAASTALNTKNKKALWNLGCTENPYTPNPGVAASTDFCSVRAGTFVAQGICAALKAAVAAGLPDCGVLAACGALHTMTTSVLSIVALIIAAWAGPKVL